MLSYIVLIVALASNDVQTTVMPMPFGTVERCEQRAEELVDDLREKLPSSFTIAAACTVR